MTWAVLTLIESSVKRFERASSSMLKGRLATKTVFCSQHQQSPQLTLLSSPVRARRGLRSLGSFFSALSPSAPSMRASLGSLVSLGPLALLFFDLALGVSPSSASTAVSSPSSGPRRRPVFC